MIWESGVRQVSEQQGSYELAVMLCQGRGSSEAAVMSQAESGVSEQ